MEMRSTFRFQVFEVTEQELKILKKHGLIDPSVSGRHTLYIMPKKALETIVSLDEKADQREALQRQAQEMSEKLDASQSRLSNIERELAEAKADGSRTRDQLKRALSENEKLKRENTEINNKLRNAVKRLEEQMKRG